MVVNGAGAAAVSCSKMYLSLGVKKENLVMFDINGVLDHQAEPIWTIYAMEFATDRKDVKTLADAMKECRRICGFICRKRG
jgi:malate dehydrogenase (oxaloacetate-decarboxylating)(NADP+)